MLCNTFMTLAVDIWNQISIGKAVNFQLKEETLTDQIILSLKLRHQHDISIIEFTKHQEGKIGADWEWWFVEDSGRSIGMRIQAKIISIANSCFNHLHYQKQYSIPQCEKLIMQAERKQLSPLYCLYTTADNIHPTFGCSLLDAYTVRSLRSKGTSDLLALRSLITPWHELVCHTPDITLIDHVNNFLGNITNNSAKVERILQATPWYVEQIISSEGQIFNLDYADSSLNGIVVIRTNLSR